MNERIRELARQAELNLELQSLKVEKFAELIIRECAKLVEDNIDPQNAWITPGYIKEHFGVEE